MKSIKTCYSTFITTYFSFIVLLVVGHIRDLFGRVFKPKKYSNFFEKNGVPPIYTVFESFFIRRLYQRISDCWNRPIINVPGRVISIMERKSLDHNESFELTGKLQKALNFGSYNYLGIAECNGKVIESDLEILEQYDITCPYPTIDMGPNLIVKKLEEELADYLQKEDCMVFSMGFGTNSWNIPSFMHNSLIFSDELNHASLVYGMRQSRSKVVVYKHNNMKDLEKKLIKWISQGQPQTHRAWNKIFVVIEGIFSMEGTIIDLRYLLDLKKKYKFYIYMDEAHSIGAIGKTGRGVCEALNIDFNDVDILMGTFSKSFGGFGGYIAGSKELISYLRNYSDGSLYTEQMSPVVANQILQSLRKIKADPSIVKRLYENTRYIRKRLKNSGFIVLGDENSPVVPILIFNPGKIAEFSRLCLMKGLAVVVVGYPATPVISSRVRLCISASHTQQDIDKALKIINQVGTLLGMKNKK